MQVIYIGTLPGETSEERNDKTTTTKKTTSNSVISGAASDCLTPWGALEYNYISEIVLPGGKGAGVWYPPRNQSLAAARPGSLWEGWGRGRTPKLLGTCSKVTPVHKGEHLKVTGSAVSSTAIRGW